MSTDNQPSSILFADVQLMSAQLAELVSAVPACYYTRSELEGLAVALRELLGAAGRVRVRGARREATHHRVDALERELIDLQRSDAAAIVARRRDEIRAELEELRKAAGAEDAAPSAEPGELESATEGTEGTDGDGDDAAARAFGLTGGTAISTPPQPVGRVLAGLKR